MLVRIQQEALKTEQMKDTDLMPFGKYKGKEMQDVPDDYLIWLHKENKCFGKLKEYIEDNFDVTVKK